MYGTHITGTGL